MNYSTYSFTLDLHETQAQVSLPVKFGDTGRKLYITLTDGGSPYILNEGSWAVLYAKKADGNTLTNNCTIDPKNMAIMYSFTEETANCIGTTQCEIIIYGSNGEVVGSPRFIMIVDDRVISATNVTSNTEWSAVDNVFIKAAEYEQAEADRVTAENSRVEAEETRKSAEEDRVVAEELRVEAEDLRESTETSRVSAEISRVSAENSRVAAEKLRVEAEKTRTTFIPSVSDEGVLSWTNDKGLENPAPVSLVESVINALPYAEGGSF